MPTGIYPRTKEQISKLVEMGKKYSPFQVGHKLLGGGNKGNKNPNAIDNPQTFKKGCTPWNKGVSGLFHHSEETKSKIRKTLCGLDSPAQRQERNDPAYQNWVNKVKNRDKGVCRLQSENCMGYKVVHHILPWRDYPEERYNINNGITLCQYHHPHKRVDEQRLMPTFQELVGSNVK